MDDDSSQQPGAASKVDERIYALLAMIEDQQTAVRAGLEGLAQERAALATERVALVQQAERMERLSDKLSGQLLGAIPRVVDSAGQAASVAVAKVLEGTAAAAVQAAATAAKPTLDGLKEAVSWADATQLQLRTAVKNFRREWMWATGLAVLGMIVAAALITMGSVWLETEKIAQLMEQKSKLTAEISALQEQVEQGRRNGGRKPTGK